MNQDEQQIPGLRDYGAEPVVIDIDCFAKLNTNYRTALWTGEHLQVTLMSIPVGGDIGLEKHSDLDQFIRIESGCASVMMGKCKDDLTEWQNADSNCAVLVPAETWHNVINAGNTPLKLYSIYAPPHHPFGAVQKTKEEAEHTEPY